jgi:hypothetical protein
MEYGVGYSCHVSWEEGRRKRVRESQGREEKREEGERVSMEPGKSNYLKQKHHTAGNRKNGV